MNYTFAAEASTATDAVYVQLSVVRQVVVDHQRDLLTESRKKTI